MRRIPRKKIRRLHKAVADGTEINWRRIPREWGAAANTDAPTDLAQAFGAATNTFFVRPPLAATDLRETPWIIPGLAQRGTITTVVAPGGSSKTTLLIGVGVAAAAGCSSYGPFSIRNWDGGLRVAFVTAEESPNQIGLLTNGAMQIQALTPAERQNVERNWFIHDAGASGLLFGAPRPGQREQFCPENEDRWLNQLRASLSGFDLLILDNLAALFCLNSENDNATLTALLRRVARAANEVGCAVIIVHHSPKQTRETNAASRGEVTASRGGSAIGNVSRAMLTITHLSSEEIGAFIIRGLKPGQVRRIEHAKIKDMGPMDPAYFAIITEKVQGTRDGEVATRAIQWITAPGAGAAINNKARHVAMQAIDAGTTDAHGARVPLSPGGGKSNDRDAIPIVGRALATAYQDLTEAQSRSLARQVIDDLRRLGCVAVQPVSMPQYKPDGHPNGMKAKQALICNWTLAPWISAPESGGAQ